MSNCTIVVPCYNEERRLQQAEFLEYLSRSPEVSMLFVNDGSRDKTIEMLRRLQSQAPLKIDVLDKKQNGGKGEAVRDGMLHALRSSGSGYVGFWDADLATPLSAIDDLLGVIGNRAEIDMIFGSRVKLLGREIERRPARHYLGRVFATFASLVLGLPVYDTQCGAKLFRVTPELEEILREPFCSRWIFDVEIIARFVQLNGSDPERVRGRIYEFPLYVWRDVPGSKVKPRDFLRASGELLVIRNRYMRRKISE
jgi:glycosyltransferase involved in cell wall biosynthesis